MLEKNFFVSTSEVRAFVHVCVYVCESEWERVSVFNSRVCVKERDRDRERESLFVLVCVKRQLVQREREGGRACVYVFVCECVRIYVFVCVWLFVCVCFWACVCVCVSVCEKERESLGLIYFSVVFSKGFLCNFSSLMSFIPTTLLPHTSAVHLFWWEEIFFNLSLIKRSKVNLHQNHLLSGT